MPAKTKRSAKSQSKAARRPASKAKAKSKGKTKTAKPTTRRGGKPGAAADSMANPGKAVRTAFLSRMSRS